MQLRLHRTLLPALTGALLAITALPASTQTIDQNDSGFTGGSPSSTGRTSGGAVQGIDTGPVSSAGSADTADMNATGTGGDTSPGTDGQSSSGAGGNDKAEGKAASSGQPRTNLLIIAPAEIRTDPALANGCWVRLFPQPGFKGDNDLTIAGPLELPALHEPSGNVYWKPTAESLIVGPKARVTVYEHASFRDRSATLKPGSQEPQLRSALKFTQSIGSLKIACEKQ
jgi:hypothetical protein